MLATWLHLVTRLGYVDGVNGCANTRTETGDVFAQVHTLSFRKYVRFETNAFGIFKYIYFLFFYFFYSLNELPGIDKVGGGGGDRRVVFYYFRGS